MSWLEQKYINLLSNRLPKFKRKNANLWNFRCPICGDSDSNKSKARGYIFHKTGKYTFYCHNCNKTLAFNNFLKEIDQNLYNEYTLECLKEQGGAPRETVEPLPEFKMQSPVFNKKKDPLKSISKISSLKTHPAKDYVVKRQIPTPYHAKLFYCPKFKSWVNTFIPDKFTNIKIDEPRLIIPFFNENGDMIGLQGRSFNPKDSLKYITIITDESYPRLYGVDMIDKTESVYIFEGPIDSMFIKNSIASAGGEIIRELPRLGLDNTQYVVIYDNEPRNKETVKKMEHAIDAGYTVCIWPNTVILKDINDMIKAEITDFSYVNTELVGRISNRIRKLIDQNSYSGLQAKLKLAEWRKC